MLEEYVSPPMDVAIREELEAYVVQREEELQGVNLYN